MMSMLVTSNELQIVADAVDRREPAQLAERFLGEADLVLVEGFSLIQETRSRFCVVNVISRRAARLRLG